MVSTGETPVSSSWSQTCWLGQHLGQLSNGLVVSPLLAALTLPCSELPKLDVGGSNPLSRS